MVNCLFLCLGLVLEGVVVVLLLTLDFVVYVIVGMLTGLYRVDVGGLCVC